MGNDRIASIRSKGRNGSYLFGTSMKRTRKTQRVIHLGGRIFKNLDRYCLEKRFKPSEAVNNILKNFFARSRQES